MVQPLRLTVKGSIESRPSELVGLYGGWDGELNSSFKS